MCDLIPYTGMGSLSISILLVKVHFFFFFLVGLLAFMLDVGRNPVVKNEMPRFDPPIPPTLNS